MAYNTQLQGKFASKVPEPLPEFNSEYASPHPSSHILPNCHY